MKINKNQFVTSVFLPFSIGILLITLVSIASIYIQQNEAIVSKSLTSLKQAEEIYKQKSLQYQKIFVGFIDMIQNDPDVLNAYQKGDREALYRRCQSIADILKKQVNISHFYFHSPDKSVFLRVHHPQYHSDTIHRYTLDTASRTQQVSFGIEMGVLKTLTFRVVKPWIIKGQLIGYIELGEEIDYMANMIQQELPKVAHALILIQKDLVEPTNDIEWQKMLQSKGKYLDTGNYLLINSTITSLPKNFIEILDQPQQYINANIVIEAKNYRLNSIALQDAKEKVIGKIVLLLDVQEEETVFTDLVIKETIVILVIALFLLLSYYIYARRIIMVSNRDALTTLFNRRYFNHDSEKKLSSAIKNGQYLNLFVIDVDHFKLYNDTYGHIKGDTALQFIGQTLDKVFSHKGQTAYRVGGEEFAVMFLSDDATLAQTLSQRLLQAIESSQIEHIKNSHYKVVTVSIGAATAKADNNTSIAHLYCVADQALYKAKEGGRNRVIFLDHSDDCV